jgi:hypothetical protein
VRFGLGLRHVREDGVDEGVAGVTWRRSVGGQVRIVRVVGGIVIGGYRREVGGVGTRRWLVVRRFSEVVDGDGGSDRKKKDQSLSHDRSR